MIRLASAVGRVLPEALRVQLFRSSAAPVLRHVLNHLCRTPGRLTVVPLAGCLRGHRMLLDWHTQKGYAFGLCELSVVDVVMRTVRPGWTVVDVGAHIGYYTLLLRKLVGASGRVVAFEPIPRNFDVLRRNLALNDYLDIEVENCAVAERSGSLAMTCQNDDPLPSVSVLVEEGDFPVRCMALDEYFTPREPVHFVKIDVEGAELRVLAGMERIARDHRPIVIVEVHGYRDDHEVLTHLTRTGYQFRLIDEAGHHVLATPS